MLTLTIVYATGPKLNISNNHLAQVIDTWYSFKVSLFRFIIYSNSKTSIALVRIARARGILEYMYIG